jgi:hypothetical protein
MKTVLVLLLLVPQLQRYRATASDALADLEKMHMAENNIITNVQPIDPVYASVMLLTLLERSKALRDVWREEVTPMYAAYGYLESSALVDSAIVHYTRHLAAVYILCNREIDQMPQDEDWQKLITSSDEDWHKYLEFNVPAKASIP